MCDVPTIGEQLMGNLTEILWYVNGHHNAFKGRGFQIPTIFSCFTGYNSFRFLQTQKKEVGNLSGEILDNNAKHLFICLLSSYWAILAWHSFKNDLEYLARSLYVYPDYLGKKSKQLKLLHSQLQPVHTTGENLQCQYLPSASVI